MLYPQNGDCIVAIDSVTSLHPVYAQQLKVTYRRYARCDNWLSVALYDTCADRLLLSKGCKLADFSSLTAR